ncbi:MAG: hypothetical protein M0O99_00490 [Desulfuromonas thiophila]|jgi:hypothetical protein|nr:hypothetical protein [Desulfuromonas thiophila]MDY0251350.1 hypothetical protein [Pseudomonas sp.]
MNRTQIAGLILGGVPVLYGQLADCFEADRQRLEKEELSDAEYLCQTLADVGICRSPLPLTARKHLN